MRTKARIEEHEGRRNRPYRCSEGYLTVGVGRNLDKVPFSDAVIDLMFKEDYTSAEKEARRSPAFEFLNEVRRGVLIEMCFQMGGEPFDGDGFRDFKRFLGACVREDWETASAEMLDSKWARAQTPKRAKRLAAIFLTGEYDS